MRKNRLEKWEESITTAANQSMKKRWDFLFVLSWYHYLEELERLISEQEILFITDYKQKALEKIKKIKYDYPFDKKPILPTWKIELFTGEVLLVASDLKKILIFSDFRSVERFEPANRARQIIEAKVRVSNKRGLALYKKNGYAIEGTRQKAAFINGQFEDEFFIAKCI